MTSIELDGTDALSPLSLDSPVSLPDWYSAQPCDSESSAYLRDDVIPVLKGRSMSNILLAIEVECGRPKADPELLDETIATLVGNEFSFGRCSQMCPPGLVLSIQHQVLEDLLRGRRTNSS